MRDTKTETELLAELSHLDARIAELRGARSALVYDLEWAVKERDRIRRHLREVPLLGEHGEDLDGAA